MVKDHVQVKMFVPVAQVGKEMRIVLYSLVMQLIIVVVMEFVLDLILVPVGLEIF